MMICKASIERNHFDWASFLKDNAKVNLFVFHFELGVDSPGWGVVFAKCISGRICSPTTLLFHRRGKCPLPSRVALCNKGKILSLSPWLLLWCEMVACCLRACTGIGDVSWGPLIFQGISKLSIWYNIEAPYCSLQPVVRSNPVLPEKRFQELFTIFLLVNLHYIFITVQCIFALASEVQTFVHEHKIATCNCTFGNKPFLKDHLHRSLWLSVTPWWNPQLQRTITKRNEKNAS